MVKPGRSTPFSSASASTGRITYPDISVYSNTSDSQKLRDTSAELILQNLQDRLNAKEEMYTSLGDKALIALNPLRALSLNSDATSKRYAANAKSFNEKEELPPHVFNLVSSAYLHMLRSKEDQGIILCGETGSGKSESHNRIARHLFDVSKISNKKSRVQSAILRIDSVLSAFGNCSTTHNKNASCFSRYTEYQFDALGHLVGAKTIEALLDKHRVVGNSIDSRNFHIFYYLVCGASSEEKEQWYLSDPAHFHYLNQSKVAGMSSNEAAGHLYQLREDLKSVGIGKRQQAQVYQTLAAILHLGNINFLPGKSSKEDSCVVKNYQQLDLVATLLGVSPQELEDTLTFKTVVIRKEVSTVLLDVQGAIEQRDALAKSLYVGIFNWIAEQINEKLCQDDSQWKNFIGVLDCPGFSTSGSSFYSLASNYIQERLHEFTTDQLFNIPASQFKEDNVSVPSDLKISSSSVIPLLSRPKDGILSIIALNSARSQTSASSTTFSEKIKDQIYASTSTFDDSEKEFFIASNINFGSLSRMGRSTGSTKFGIKHFLGPVEYDTSDFAASAVDSIQPDFITLFRGSPEQVGTTNPFIRTLFSDKLVATTMVSHLKEVMVARAQSKVNRHPSLKRMKKKKDGKKNAGENNAQEHDDPLEVKKFSDLTTLGEILETLAETRTWFIFHLCPTSDSTTGKFNNASVIRQIKGFNLVEFAHSQTVLYSARIAHGEFKRKFEPVHTSLRLDLAGNPSNQCFNLIRYKKWNVPRDALSGKSYLYLSETSWRALDRETLKVEEIALELAREKRQSAGFDSLAGSSHSSMSHLIGRKNESDTEIQKPDEYSDTDSHYESEFDSPVIQKLSPNPKKEVSNVVPRQAPQDPEKVALRSSEAVELTDVHEPVKASGKRGKAAKPPKKKKVRRPMSASRCRWLTLTWLLTFCIPPYFTSCCMRHHEQRIAWREKVALCVLVFLMCGFILFFIVGIGLILCPKQNVLSRGELTGFHTVDKPYIHMYGFYYVIPEILKKHLNNYSASKGLWEAEVLGQDVSQMIPKDAEWNKFCPSFDKPPTYQLFPQQSNCITLNQCYTHVGNPSLSITNILDQVKPSLKGKVVWDATSIADFLKQSSCNKIIRAYDRIYDVSSFYCGQYRDNYFGPTVKNIFERASTGTTDSTNDFEALKATNQQQWTRVFTCMEGLYRVGDIDHRNDLKCVIPNYILLVSSCILVAVIGFKFLAALQFTPRRQPEDHDKFVICQVPCYTEGETSLRKTIDSLATLEYDDRHKLLFIICDGMIIGAGNDRPTPRIVLDILGVDPSVDPETFAFQSLGEGSRELNYGKIYSGLYEVAGRFVPFIVIVKVGKPTEKQKPGNRGKRDSQMILMRFLSRVHFNQPMSPLELDLYHQMKNVIGVDPAFYEYIFMVDADTEVFPDSLNRMVSAMTRDSKIMGICGETQLTNERDSWVTMIQVYEYFISHHLAKAFESLFGSVTCLPGCFSLYRIRTASKNVPLLVSPGLIEDYSRNEVHTLHLKNLLHLGEDRYLTTLMMKHFPHMKTAFTPDAQCRTNCPDKWSVLQSQRRRWINSTVHNLLELMFLPELCGFCCFSMRFVVFLDLFATIVQPAVLLYIGYLVYSVIFDQNAFFPFISLVMIGAIYGLQVIIFLLRREWAHFGWMIIYLLATPIWTFFLPLYSFWRFDDFSWGDTRRVVGEDGKTRYESKDYEEFDPSSVPLRSWADYEKELMEKVSEDRSDSQADSETEGSLKYAASIGYGPGSVYGEGSVYGFPQNTPAYQGSHAGTNVPSQYAPSNAGFTTQPIASSVAQSIYDYAMDPKRRRSGYFVGGGPPSVAGDWNAVPPIPQIPSQYTQINQPSQTKSPTDEELLDEIRHILSTRDLMTVTKKSVREELARLFGMDMTPRKDYIHKCIDMVLQNQI
ncbi:hypothetical protein HK098_004289 [Nowakowskiella sp. JEL0407]|nr:hypothetical protein HK098_004289 [Nowakowskiella sp. JEL0407]